MNISALVRDLTEIWQQRGDLEVWWNDDSALPQRAGGVYVEERLESPHVITTDEPVVIINCE